MFRMGVVYLLCCASIVVYAAKDHLRFWDPKSNGGYLYGEFFLPEEVPSANLVLIWRLLRSRLLISRDDARLIAFALACFLPQVVMFGDFVSNDTLTMLLGTLQFAVAIAWLQRPQLKTLIILAVLVGAGLLTKGTFLLTGPALGVIIAIVAGNDSNR